VRDGYIEVWTDEGWDRAVAAGARAGSELRELVRRVRDGTQAKRAEGRHVNGRKCLPCGLKWDKHSATWSYDESYTAKIAEAYRILPPASTFPLPTLPGPPADLPASPCGARCRTQPGEA
jgi:hypothetical protein